jgi:hypothetical protein
MARTGSVTEASFLWSTLRPNRLLWVSVRCSLPQRKGNATGARKIPGLEQVQVGHTLGVVFLQAGRKYEARNFEPSFIAL